MAVYYNDNDPFACAWLRELIKDGQIAPGDVDERAIKEISADDLKGYTQHHFFAGIGGWSYALRLAGWPADRPVWTGSCPCQPFSTAGKGLAEDDSRHLWPDWFQLISQCQPTTVFGEQVASRLGREWLSGVRADLETVGYAVGAADLCAASIGPPQIRQRLWWVGIINSTGPQPGKQATSSLGYGSAIIPAGDAGGLPDTGGTGHEMARDNKYYSKQDGSGKTDRARRLDDAGFWSDFDILPFKDGKARRVEPGTFPLAHGVPARMGRLRGYGNAINPQIAATFIQACREVLRLG